MSRGYRWEFFDEVEALEYEANLITAVGGALVFLQGAHLAAVTEDKVKVSFMVPRHLSKALMTLYIQAEIDEVKRRLESDVYDALTCSGQQTAETEGGAA